MNKTFIVDVHDLAYRLPGLDEILALKEIYPDLKITCFTIPLPLDSYCYKVNRNFEPDYTYKDWIEQINSYEWMEIGLHGLCHQKKEMVLSYEEAKKLVKNSEKIFDDIGLKYKKIFAAPYWQYSHDALKALRDMDYVVVLRKKQRVPRGLNIYIHSWSFNQKQLPLSDVIRAHGHLSETNNKDAIMPCLKNIIKNISPNSKFNFISKT